ncbi:hypothetical protein KIN20_019018 [Parelaphostrongylus tenuis]|uniref:Uncharacterized protein n=1 Tax=Parelaphostrongylus tenuis TaxID=148309 RepID=A0AAD5QPZ9_PARTN|nr:hypothetical protein KIN20_019018 [Parelaphostrongylus tenuis]
MFRIFYQQFHSVETVVVSSSDLIDSTLFKVLRNEPPSAGNPVSTQHFKSTKKLLALISTRIIRCALDSTKCH